MQHSRAIGIKKEKVKLNFMVQTHNNAATTAQSQRDEGDD